MDIPIAMNPRPSESSSPIIARANYCQFRPGQRVHHLRVESRMLLWCINGRGSIRVNGNLHPFVPGEYLFLPWGHEILYEADAKSPFFVGGIHIIPYHREGVPFEFVVSHHPSDSWAGLKSRRDIFWPELQGVIRRNMEEDRLGRLASYVVEVFCHGNNDETAMRDLARVVVREIAVSAAAGNASDGPLPRALRRMQDHVRSQLATDLAVAELARIGQCSIPTVHRLFRDFLDTTPGQFIARLRMFEAKHLLRTTSLSVSEVAARVGISDPFHFSRFFKRHIGISPRAYRQSVSIV